MPGPTIAIADIIGLTTALAGKYGRIVKTTTASVTLPAVPGHDVLCFASGTGVTITLPSAATNGALYIVKNTDASNTVTLSSASTIDDTSVAAGECHVLASDGTQWRRIAITA